MKKPLAEQVIAVHVRTSNVDVLCLPKSAPYLEQRRFWNQKENLLTWLTDEKGRDQFVVRFGSDTEVYWNERLGKPEPVYHRNFWTESFVQWSPLGTYLATIHRQGAAVWGETTTFNRITRFIHRQKVILNVFDVRTGKVLREFKGTADDYATGGVGGVSGVSWPVFRWAGGKDDKYFARIGKNAISVYETVTMGLLDKKSVKVDNVADFSWSPTDSILACFVPEGNGRNEPARVSLVQIPSREELRQKKLFSERDIPIEVLELENKNDKIVVFAWEPKGHRFAIIHGVGPKPDVTFYSMKSPNNVARVTKLTTLKGKQANALFWSPVGRFIVLAGLKAYNGQLEFYNVDELESMASADHFMATDVDWDPTGRFVATSVTSVHQIENGFNMWSFSGKLLYRLPRDRFFQFLWRPRPPSLLTPEKEEEIAKNLKKYSKKYEIEDAESSLLLSAADLENRRKVQDEWKACVAEWKHLHEEERRWRMELRDGEPSDEEEECEAEEVEIEEILNIEEESVAFGFEQLD
ncbi:hypothetical protein L7F22_057001 [Adiantum nelumboides]|nr:hypothetical protein [Adiantum nelumboides]